MQAYINIHVHYTMYNVYIEIIHVYYISAYLKNIL